MTTTMTEEDAAADMIRARAEERAAAALASADAALAAPRPWPGGGDAYEAMAREAAAPVPHRRDTPAPPPAPSSAAALADDENGFVRKGVLLMLLQGVIVREREHAAKTIDALARRVEALESKGKRGKNGNR